MPCHRHGGTAGHSRPLYNLCSDKGGFFGSGQAAGADGDDRHGAVGSLGDHGAAGAHFHGVRAGGGEAGADGDDGGGDKGDFHVFQCVHDVTPG